MADTILDCKKVLDEDLNVQHWIFSYLVEKDGSTNSFWVMVLAEEMTDPTSASEAKDKANTKAAAIKAAWQPEQPSTVSAVDANKGSVTL